MDVPYSLRGEFYPTNMTVGCPEFSRCLACNKCNNYNEKDYMCIMCESKFNKEYICNHNDDVQNSIIKIERLFKRSMSHPDDNPPPISEAVAANYKQEDLDKVEQDLSKFAKAERI